MSRDVMRFVGKSDFARVVFARLALSLIALSGFPENVGAAPWPAECKLSRAASLPFRFERGHIRIEVRVNDVPRTFAIDTGGLISSVSAEVVESQKIKARPISESIDITGIGGKRAEQYAIADTLTFGHLQASNVRLMVQPPNSAAEEDGVIGPDYLRNFDIEIDYANKILNFFHPHPCAGRAVYWSVASDSTPLEITPQGHIRLDMQLDGKDIPAILDTGSPVSLIDRMSAPTDVRDDKSPGTATLVGATGGSTETVPYRFQGMRLGTLLIAHPTLMITPYHDAFRNDHVGMILGNKELKLFHVYIAYREGRMYFTPNGK
ncbi:MAG: hypothetical protein JWP16_1907 [Alphaproteobacteria bacterium]|nr:hypothetical protein [Alphaproteobacteria bacterium]MDB5740867.1 hypothetical protein [Alphaproteobacteria bacterium]